MNDNLEPLASVIRQKFYDRGFNDDPRPPSRAAFRRWGQRVDPRLVEDFEELYYDCHWQWVLGCWKREYPSHVVSPEKMAEVQKAYSADTFPRLRASPVIAGHHWYVSGIMYMGSYHSPLARLHQLASADTVIPEEQHDYYAGKEVQCKGMRFVVLPQVAMVYSPDRLDELPTQEGLF